MGLSDRERAFKFAMDHLYEPGGDYSAVVDALAAEFAAVRAGQARTESPEEVWDRVADEAACIVDGWHISRGGYSVLAETIRERLLGKYGPLDQPGPKGR